MAAAIAGGVTSLACPPDTDPPLDEPGLVEMLKHRARSLNQAHVYPIGALTVQLAGHDAHRDGRAARSRLRRVLAGRRRRSSTRSSCGARCNTRRRSAIRSGCGRTIRTSAAAASRTTARWPRGSALPGIPAVAETIALATILALVRDTGVRVHLCRLSRAESVALVRAAKREGLPVTCDVAIHHLHLSDVDIGWFDVAMRASFRRCARTRDRAALRAGVADGTIDVVCSDHAPVDDDGKQVPFGEAEPGATGLELLLPLTLKWASGGRRRAVRRAREASRASPRG